MLWTELTGWLPATVVTVCMSGLACKHRMRMHKVRALRTVWHAQTVPNNTVCMDVRLQGHAADPTWGYRASERASYDLLERPDADSYIHRILIDIVLLHTTYRGAAQRGPRAG